MRHTNCTIKTCPNFQRYCRRHYPGSKEKPVAPIRKFSAKREEINKKQYKPAAQKYLADHPVCEVCRKAASVDLHHKIGRVGKNLLQGFMAVCRKCHDLIHKKDKESKEKGYSESRLKKET